MTDPKPTPSIPASLIPPYQEAPVLVDGRMGRLYGASKPVDGCLLVSFRGGACGSFPASDVRFLLDSPLAMCHAARWLAQRRGHPPVSTAPEWSVEWDSDGAPCWRLRSGDEADWFPTVDTDLADAEALAAACVAVGGAS